MPQFGMDRRTVEMCDAYLTTREYDLFEGVAAKLLTAASARELGYVVRVA